MEKSLRSFFSFIWRKFFSLAKAMIFEEALWRLFLQIQRKREEKSVEAEQINKERRKSRKHPENSIVFLSSKLRKRKEVFRLAHVHREFLEIDRPKNDRRRKSIRNISDWTVFSFFSSKSVGKKVKSGWDDHRNQTKISKKQTFSTYLLNNVLIVNRF